MTAFRKLEDAEAVETSALLNNDGPVQQPIASGLKPKAIFGVELSLDVRVKLE